MILEAKQRSVETLNIEDGVKMAISATEEVQAHIIKLLTENGYKTPVPSLVRETVSNGIDAHTAVGQIKPVQVTLTRKFFMVQDFGVGLNEEDFYKYCMNLGESTKRTSNDYYGCFGSGFKSPLSYADSFEVTCRKNGTELKFLIFKGSSVPECTKIHTEETTEEDGVIVKVPVKDYYDYTMFLGAIHEQLCYFDNIVINTESETDISSKSKIFRNELFEWSEMYKGDKMHISLNGVHYPISFESLDIKLIKLPVAVRIRLDENVIPIFNREDLIYNEHSKQLIKTKITAVCDWFVNKYNETVTEIEVKNLGKIWNSLRRNNRYIEVSGKEFEVTNLPSTIQLAHISLKDFKHLKAEQIYGISRYVLDKYGVFAEINNYRFKKAYYGCLMTEIVQGKKVILCSEKPGNVQLDYIKDTIGTCIFAKVIHSTPPRKLEKKYLDRETFHRGYFSLLRLVNQPNVEWREHIQEFQKLEALLEEQMIKVETLVPTEEWIAKRKAARKVNSTAIRTTILKEQINARVVLSPFTAKTWFSLDKPKTLEISEIYKNKKVSLYGSVTQGKELQRYSLALGLTAYALVERDIKKLDLMNFHNWIRIDKIKDHKIFKKACIAEMIYNSKDVLRHSSFLKLINKQFKYDIQTLSKPKKLVNFYRCSELNEIGTQNNFWNHESLKSIERLEQANEQLGFLSYIDLTSKEGIDIAKEVYLNRKRKNKCL